MPNYRRNRVPGGGCFFTINFLERHDNHLLIQHINFLRHVVKRVRTRYYYHINGWVVLPDHLHCIWTLSSGDDDYAMRIRLINTLFARQIPRIEHRTTVRQGRVERGIWQCHFREHTIRDENDFSRHMDYLHYNPVKHGYVVQLKVWPWPTFGYHVRRGYYREDRGRCETDMSVGEAGCTCGRIRFAHPPC
ncbi:MAG: transposase [Gammaproteobacteria bacterium]|nr:transposase [Gammaproteobacteria bacterium]MDH5651094.1 transposase [Gammaproteobacteria bacterium]